MSRWVSKSTQNFSVSDSFACCTQKTIFTSDLWRRIIHQNVKKNIRNGKLHSMSAAFAASNDFAIQQRWYCTGHILAECARKSPGTTVTSKVGWGMEMGTDPLFSGKSWWNVIHHTIHVWYIYLHLVDQISHGKSWQDKMSPMAGVLWRAPLPWVLEVCSRSSWCLGEFWLCVVKRETSINFNLQRNACSWN